MKFRAKRGKAKEVNQEVKMGASGEWLQQNSFCPNGVIAEEAASVTRPLDPARWAKAEERTMELISRIQPNRPSERHRNAVASYVQRLVSNCVPCQVFTFGSVPLKTYLPDGDIDLTAFSKDQNVKENWAKDVRDMLQEEEKNEHAEFPVREVQYIQAEVKIIKCLVDNIVVDISFNQLGGLCTLCFLEEVDNLINHNHLFKRSVILIKAWCYYESRILGAHHGLISTYALETLVLYIFHVYNNSFAGPLEVLYRFLEFFSKFDWANFCVSLWGPVPINSLPSMTADPPRKDGGELLLNQMFLNACGTAYSVFRAGHENSEQRFISKHLNVIDPLRLNNNLGRSVNKGNFYRIRSAFSLGAQQLTRILECPMEDIVPELNQFFVNTWDRHGKGCRPDVPIIDDESYFRQVDTEFDEKPRERSITETPAENFSTQDTHHSSYSLQPSTIPLRYTTRSTDAHKDLRSSEEKDDESRSQMVPGSDHYYTERSNLWKKQHDVIRRTCRMNVLQAAGHGTHHFARTCSSPELTSMPIEAASVCRHNESTEKVDGNSSSRSGFSRSVKNSGTRENDAAKCFPDGPSLRESTSRRSLASDSDQSFASCPSQTVSSSNKSAVSSVHESSQRRLKEQNFMNKLTSSGIQNYGGHAQMPVNLASHSFFPFPPGMGYGPKEYSGPVPANSSAVRSDWATVMQYSNGHSSAPFNQQFRPVRVKPEPEGAFGGMNERALSTNHVDEDSGLWTDRHAHSIREINPESEDFSTASSRFSPTSPAASSRTKASSECSWDGKPSKVTDPLRHPMWKKTGSRNSSAIANSRLEEDGDPVDHIRGDANDDGKDWVHMPAAEYVTPVVTSPPLEVNQIPAFGQAQTSMSPFGPLLVHPGTQPGVAHNHAVLPVAFYPPGASVPYVTMVPVYNMPAERGTAGAHIGHNNMEERPIYHMNQSGNSLGSDNKQEQLSHAENFDSLNMKPVGEHSDECGSDIFSSDFASHWKNLQYGRLCQPSQLRHPFVYPPPVLVPPAPLQATSTIVSPRRPNSFVHAVPVSAPQSGSVKSVGFSVQYGGEVSSQRNGTGTYFPNPNFIKERQSSTPRQYRPDYGPDRNEDFGDRDANWNSNSKPRFSGRAQPRSYHEKPNTKKDRSATSISQTDRSWDTLQQNSNQFYCLSNCPSPSKHTHYEPDVLDYSVYQVHSTHSGEASSSGDALPALVMLYPHPHTNDRGSWAEDLQFGSVRPEHFIGTEVQDFSGFPNGGVYDLSKYQGNIGPPSPD